VIHSLFHRLGGKKMDHILRYVSQLRETLSQLPWEAIRDTLGVLHYARMNDAQVFIMGNGGSAATASHFACDLGKGTLLPGNPRFRVIALTDNVPTFSAYANDCGYEQVFREQLASLVRKGDVVIGISGSGNSANVLNAIEFARDNLAITIGFVGFDGGKLKGMVDICAHVPNHCMEQVEDIHLMLAHLICTCLRQTLDRDQIRLPAILAQEASGLQLNREAVRASGDIPGS
jgi:D-sedoheptulose 7-phosphate isomerase